MQAKVTKDYVAMLAYLGENLNSTPKDTEFWAAVALFVDKFSGCQRAIIAVRERGACVDFVGGMVWKSRQKKATDLHVACVF